MTDAQALALILVLVYLADCVVWVRNGGVLFSSPTRSTAARPSTGAPPEAAVATPAPPGAPSSEPSPGAGAPPGAAVAPASGPAAASPPSPPSPPPSSDDDSDWTVRTPPEASAVLKGGLVVGTILPPLGNEFIIPSWPVSLAPSGVLPFVAAGAGRAAAPDDMRLVRWDDLREVAVEGVEVRAGSRTVAVAASEASAAALADLLEDLAATPATARPEAIRKALRARLDLDAAACAVGEWRRVTKVHRILANVHFVLLAVVVAALAGWWPAQLVWIWVALAALPVHVVTVRLASKAFAKLRPDARSERRKLVWTAALSPLSAIRSGSALSRDVLAAFDPVVAAHLLLPLPAFREFAARLVADLRLPRRPVCPADGAGAAEAEEWFRTEWRAATEEWLRAQGTDPDALLAPPPKRGDNVVSWCPRCRTCYDIPPGACTDCGGIPLVPYEVPPAA